MAMTVPEMLRQAADVFEQSNDRDRALLAVEHILHEVQTDLYKRRPGLDIDRMLGNEEEVTNG